MTLIETSHYNVIVVVGAGYKIQLQYYHTQHITPENREFVVVSDDMLTHDEPYNKYVLGYIQKDGHHGYYRNKNAKFISYHYGPALLVDKDKKRHYQLFKKNINLKLTEKRFKDLVPITLLRNYEFLTVSSFAEILDIVSQGMPITVVTVETL